MFGVYDQVHVLHRYGAEQHRISHDHSAGEAYPAFKFYPDRPDIWYLGYMAIGQFYFALLQFCQFELQRDSFCNAQLSGAGIHEALCFQRLEFGASGI